ncbi:MAG: four helix bundle protein [Opitutia bacterium]|jgi:four helix bundle protein
MQPSTHQGPAYKDLRAWTKARDLAVDLLKLVESGLLAKSRSLSDQMQRAAISVPSNIAEGEERGTNKDALRFLFISKGSLAELRTQLEIAHLAGHVSHEDYVRLESASDQVARLLSGLIRSRVLRERANPNC